MGTLSSPLALNRRYNIVIGSRCQACFNVWQGPACYLHLHTGGSGRRWRGPKPMVTPVHRFQNIECVTGQYAHSHMRRHNRQACMSQPAYSVQRLDGVGVSTEVPVRPHAVELDSSVFLDLPLDGTTDEQTHVVIPHLDSTVGKFRWFMWTSIALATLTIVGAKFYYNNNQETTMEMIIFLSLTILVLLAGCSFSLCKSNTTRDLLAAAVTSSVAYGPAHPPTLPPMQVIHAPPTENLHQPPPTLTEPPPPPYHIAILLPQQLNQEEVPPPSYEKAVS